MEQVMCYIAVCADTCKHFRVFDQKGAADERDSHHFVSVPAHTVCKFYSVHKCPMFDRKLRTSTPCSINVMPKSLAVSDITNLANRVESATNGGTCRRDDTKRCATFTSSSVNLILKRLGLHAPVGITGHFDDVLVANPNHVCSHKD